ncbi:uncharacterized protein LOC126896497 [Daktulosphaira vitifoliae]|uniref:uncharacterized protein LOC126896497 n=1 Tax=Daktulosphaira vitifoliae TaxID=58002 RepID=UPI0021AA33B2|nr:uncharacterized protein LOC126896497 [Daktulosphaira vitifoliae]
MRFAGYCLNIPHPPHEYEPGLIEGQVDAPRLLGELCFRIPSNTRLQCNFYIPTNKTNFSRNAPLIRMITLVKANKLIGRVSSSKVENREIKENQYSCQQSSCGQTNKFISHVKLAPISIPVFTGEYSEWKLFYDLFSKLIHVNANLSDIQKFCYLRSSLSGETANIIKSLETTANNYEIAWIM